VPETPEELYERAKDFLRTPPVDEWETWPFAGKLPPRPLQPPVERERPRHGEDGADCRACSSGDDDYFWTNERWRLHAIDPPSGLPVVVLLEPRDHYDAPGDLPDDLAGELGVMLARVERAVRTVPHLERVHVCRWGDGSAHLHWWFMARPARFPQLAGNFAAIWDDILPPVPAEVARENVELVRRAMAAGDS
jgi:diadenosine tetraphosphate (Ap4A) HIT family hydrolase